MNEIEFRILDLCTKIERNTKLSKQLKVLAGVCFFLFAIVRNLDKDEVVATNLVWIISIIALIGIYIKDSYCVKNNKSYELDIYRLRVEDLERKKRIAEIRGEGLPDFVINTKIDVPNEEVSLPIIYYSILLVIDIIIRIFLVIKSCSCKEPDKFQLAGLLCSEIIVYTLFTHPKSVPRQTPFCADRG